MPKLRPVLLIIVFLAAGCATQKPGRSVATKHVRTTAYTHTEAGGRNNACGQRLSCGVVHSASADWSRYPLGTRFQIISTGEICEIDDYGSALVGTDTIDLYKNTRDGMRRWGVRNVEIKILQWGSPRRSLEILSPRTHKGYVAQMVAALRKQTQGVPQKFKKIES